jgi:HK97 family phage major capsid protein
VAIFTTGESAISPETTSAIATLGWVARAKALVGRSDRHSVENWLAANGAPAAAQRIFAKATVGSGNTIDSDLADGISISAWSDSLRTRSVFYRLLADSAFMRVPMRTRVGLAISTATGAVVPEGAAIPVSRITLDNVLLEPVKASALIVCTNELLQNVSAAGQQLFNRELMGAVSDAVDTEFLDLVTSTGTTSTASAGVTSVDAKHDLRTALLALDIGGASKLYWIATPDVAARASTLADTAGGDAFAAMSASGGELANLPAIVSSGVPSGSLYLVDASGIAADGGPVTVETSWQADVLMDTAPTAPGGSAMTSLFKQIAPR